AHSADAVVVRVCNVERVVRTYCYSPWRVQLTCRGRGRAVAVVAWASGNTRDRSYLTRNGVDLAYRAVAGVRDVKIAGRIQCDPFGQKELRGGRRTSVARIALALRRACNVADISIDIDTSNDLISAVGEVDVSRAVDGQAAGCTDGRQLGGCPVAG